MCGSVALAIHSERAILSTKRGVSRLKKPSITGGEVGGGVRLGG